jgi:integrase
MGPLIEAYIRDHANAWAPTTLKSERARLRAASAFFSRGDLERPSIQYKLGLCEKIYAALLGRKPYTIATTWSRVTNFYDWLIVQGKCPAPNPFKEWRNKNRRLFKHVYKRRPAPVGFEEARRRIEAISDGTIRDKCLELLTNGLRYSETLKREGKYVTGKGGKRRRVYGLPATGEEVPYHRIVFHLGEVGLKPHDLRKCFATEMHRRGMDQVDLCKVMGWESFETARSYLQPKKDEELEALVNGA